MHDPRDSHLAALKCILRYVHGTIDHGHVRVLHVSSRFQYADIFTKGLQMLYFLSFTPV